MLDFYDDDVIADIDAVGLPGEILMHILNEIVPAARGKLGNPFG